jgi:hypothetical protein
MQLHVRSWRKRTLPDWHGRCWVTTAAVARGEPAHPIRVSNRRGRLKASLLGSCSLFAKTLAAIAGECGRGGGQFPSSVLSLFQPDRTQPIGSASSRTLTSRPPVRALRHHCDRNLALGCKSRLNFPHVDFDDLNFNLIHDQFPGLRVAHGHLPEYAPLLRELRLLERATHKGGRFPRSSSSDATGWFNC